MTVAATFADYDDRPRLTVQLRARIDPDLAEALAALAGREGTSVSIELRRAIRAHISTRVPLNDADPPGPAGRGHDGRFGGHRGTG